MICNQCNRPTTLNASTRAKDGYKWRCNPCKKCWSIRSDSFFEGSHLPIDIILQLAYYWSRDTPPHTVSNELGVSSKTVVDWNNFLRDLCVRWCDTMPAIGGIDENGEQKIVELDESCFFRRKHNVGRLGPHQWVFGGIERASRKCFMAIVPNRTRVTLQPIIERHVSPGNQSCTQVECQVILFFTFKCVCRNRNSCNDRRMGGV